MKPPDTATGLSGSHLPACLQHLTAVVAAVVREDGQLLECNAGFRRLLQLRGDAASDNVAAFFVQPRFSQLAAAAVESGQPIHDGVLNVGDEQRACSSLLGSVHRNGPNLILLAEYDVAEMERLNAQLIQLNEQLSEMQRALARNERRLFELSSTDPLTGLANRRRLDEFLLNECERAQRYGETFSVIMADIDHFKHVNDRHGHDVGDELLLHFAALLLESMRDIDLAARFGGEEFVVVMPKTGLNAATACAERLRANVRSLHLPTLPETLSASFGVAQHQPGDTIHSLLKHADKALYAAKSAGRDRVEAYPFRAAAPPSSQTD